MRLPSYRCHKASGQAVVTLRGVDHYLGVHDSDQSRQKYQELISAYQKTEATRKKKASAKAKSQPKDGPSYRLHSRSGQGIVTIAGRTYYLGKYGSAESKSKYHRLKAEYIASGLSDTFGVPASHVKDKQVWEAKVQTQKVAFEKAAADYDKAVETQGRSAEEMNKAALKGARGLLDAAKGWTQLGLIGEENSKKLLESLVYVEGRDLFQINVG